MSRFVATALPLSGLTLLERQVVGDQRGFLSRMFCAEELAASGWLKPIAQINHTYTRDKGTVRGLHFQREPFCEAKLVSVVRGEIWDVAVDLRNSSPTYLCWHAERLSAKNSRAMLIPEGFAHGFQSITDDVDMIYCHSTAYDPTSEDGLNPSDSRLAITWPLSISEISQRDQDLPHADDDFVGFIHNEM
jgi:dTDP-4-dehydrorhamnose 3,5-epimerase